MVIACCDSRSDFLRAQEISAHSLKCVACRPLLRALARESAMLKDAMYDRPKASECYDSRPPYSMPFGFGLLQTNREPRTGRKQ